MTLDIDVLDAVKDYPIFVSLFTGFCLDPANDRELIEDFDNWQKQRSKRSRKEEPKKKKARHKSWLTEWEKDREKAKTHFMYNPMFRQKNNLRDTYLSVFERMKQGDYSFIPTAEDALLVRRWNDALQDNIQLGRTYLTLMLDSLCIDTALDRQFIRNVMESREILEMYIDKNGKELCPDLTSDYKKKLKAAKKLDPHIAQQKLDMQMYLALEKSVFGIAGGVIRRKSSERAARKVADTFVEILKKHEAYKRGKHSSRKKNYPRFNLTYKDVLFTDMVAFSVIGIENLPNYNSLLAILDLFPIEFADQKNDKIRVINPLQRDMCCRMRRSIAKTDAEPICSAEQHRLKLFSMHDGGIFDFHCDTLTGMVDRAFGVSAHHIMVHTRHMESLKDNAKPRGSKITYGQMYQAIYERAKSFFSAMPVSLDERISDYIASDSSKDRASMRGRMRRDVLRPLKLIKHADWFLKEYADKKNGKKLTKTSASKLRQSLAIMIGADDKNKFTEVKKRVRPSIWRAITCYLIELESIASREESLLDYKVDCDSNVSVSISKSASTLIDNLNLYTRLHDVLYFKPDPEGPLLDDEKTRFRHIRNDVNDLIFFYRAFLREKNRIVSSYEGRADLNPSNIVKDYKSLYDLYMGLTNKIEIMKETNHPAVIRSKRDMMLVLGNHMLEVQGNIYQALESASLGKSPSDKKLLEKQEALLNTSSAMYTVKNKIMHFYQAAQGTFSEPVRIAYEMKVVEFKATVPITPARILD